MISMPPIYSGTLRNTASSSSTRVPSFSGAPTLEVRSGSGGTSKPVSTAKASTNQPVSRFTRLEDFIIFASGNGVVVKDNRQKGGCLWVKSDPRIDSVIKEQIFGDHGFKYTEKSKALGGVPGWYY